MEVENRVARDKQLYSSAVQAYISFVRSYASYPREARQTFCFKDLHLGHCAKSFALRDPPTKITGVGRGHWVKKEERKTMDVKKEENIIKAQKRRIDEKKLIMSEFSSGLDAGPGKESKKRKKMK